MLDLVSSMLRAHGVERVLVALIVVLAGMVSAAYIVSLIGSFCGGCRVAGL